MNDFGSWEQSKYIDSIEALSYIFLFQAFEHRSTASGHKKNYSRPQLNQYIYLLQNATDGQLLMLTSSLGSNSR